jgi:SAGA-associated factor 29
MDILAALRGDDEPMPSASRSTSVGHGKPGRDRHNKRKLTDTTMEDRDSIAAESPPDPSYKGFPISSQKDRLNIKTSGSRAGSAPAAREASALLEDDKDDQGKGKKKHSSDSLSSRRGAAR